jgi:hypothetical protein
MVVKAMAWGFCVKDLGGGGQMRRGKEGGGKRTGDYTGVRGGTQGEGETGEGEQEPGREGHLGET